MKESTGALAWIAGIVILIVVIGLMIRGVRDGLEHTFHDPNAQSAREEQLKQQHLMEKSELDQKRMMRDAERQLRQNERLMHN